MPLVFKNSSWIGHNSFRKKNDFKQEISAKMSLLALFSSFNLTVLLTFFTFTLDKIHFCWKYFHLYLSFTASFFTFTVLPWLLCNFVLTFILTFMWYTLTLMLFDCSIFTVTMNYYFTLNFNLYYEFFLLPWLLWMPCFNLYIKMLFYLSQDDCSLTLMPGIF